MRRPGPLFLERLENGRCLSMQNEHVMKGYLLLPVLAAIVMTAMIPCAYADLFVSSTDTGEVLRYNQVTGEFIDKYVSQGSGGLENPFAALLGPDGNLYVSDAGNNNSVMRYDGTTGAPLPAPGKSGAIFITPGDGGLQGPWGMIFGRDGNLYVASHFNDSVLRYSGTTGDFLDTFVPEGSGGLHLPRGMVFGPDGNLYVNRSMGPGWMRYDGTTGDPLPAPGQMGAVFASGNYPNGNGPTMVFGPDGNLYTSSFVDNRVVRLNGTTGELIDTFVSPGSGGLSGPTGLIFGPDNNLYVISSYNNSVLRYDGATGAFIDTFIPPGSGGLGGPLYLVFTNADPTTLAYVPAPQSRFLITAAPTAVSDTPFDITVTALDPAGNIDTNYQGTVTFSSTDTDPGVVVPSDYTFSTGDGGDKGVHTFPSGITLVTVGNQTLTLTDKISGITGSATITVGPGP
jgi:streptogramin lyase